MHIFFLHSHLLCHHYSASSSSVNHFTPHIHSSSLPVSCSIFNTLHLPTASFLSLQTTSFFLLPCFPSLITLLFASLTLFIFYALRLSTLFPISIILSFLPPLSSPIFLYLSLTDLYSLRFPSPLLHFLSLPSRY